MSDTGSESRDRREPELHWPEGYPRTAADEREPYPGDLEPTRKEAFRSIVDEIERWGGGAVRTHTASQHYADRPNIPHQHDRADDPGVAVYYRHVAESADERFAIACDAWETQRENARAIALYARRQRLAERCEVTTAHSTHDVARLPSGDESDEDVIVAGSGGTETATPPHEVLGVAEDASDDVVEAVARRLAANYHPDNGGDVERFKEIQRARETMLDE